MKSKKKKETRLNIFFSPSEKCTWQYIPLRNIIPLHWVDKFTSEGAEDRNEIPVTRVRLPFRQIVLYVGDFQGELFNAILYK